MTNQHPPILESAEWTEGGEKYRLRFSRRRWRVWVHSEKYGRWLGSSEPCLDIFVACFWICAGEREEERSSTLKSSAIAHENGNIWRAVESEILEGGDDGK